MPTLLDVYSIIVPVHTKGDRQSALYKTAELFGIKFDHAKDEINDINLQRLGKPASLEDIAMSSVSLKAKPERLKEMKTQFKKPFSQASSFGLCSFITRQASTYCTVQARALRKVHAVRSKRSCRPQTLHSVPRTRVGPQVRAVVARSRSCQKNPASAIIQKRSLAWSDASLEPGLL